MHVFINPSPLSRFNLNFDLVHPHKTKHPAPSIVPSELYEALGLSCAEVVPEFTLIQEDFEKHWYLTISKILLVNNLPLQFTQSIQVYEECKPRAYINEMKTSLCYSGSLVDLKKVLESYEFFLKVNLELFDTFWEHF